jgi:hypothetical protein
MGTHTMTTETNEGTDDGVRPLRYRACEPWPRGEPIAPCAPREIADGEGMPLTCSDCGGRIVLSNYRWWEQ